MQCPSCGGPNKIIGNTSKQECIFCGSVFIVQEVIDHTADAILPKINP